MRSLELFVGAGGLAIGVSAAGFKHSAVFEWNKDACETLNANRLRGVKPVNEWGVVSPVDVRDIDFKQWRDRVDLLAGGPPCQPFSLGGKHRAFLDPRDMFPQAIRAVRESRPKAFIIENVKGLTRATFANYFEYITLQLTYPELTAKAEEPWADHLARLERYHTKGRRDGLRYNVVYQVLNAANYGVPQRRERVFIVGFRMDQKRSWSFPAPTHSENALIHSQWVTGDYWEKHRVSQKDRTISRPSWSRRIEQLRESILFEKTRPWRTVRDALQDLPVPREGKVSFPNHEYVSGARQYPGHTGSPLDFPAKTIKAGGHGVPGGENMLLLPSGKVRYFTVRESARLQTFPDDYHFSGSWGKPCASSAMPCQYNWARLSPTPWPRN